MLYFLYTISYDFLPSMSRLSSTPQGLVFPEKKLGQDFGVSGLVVGCPHPALSCISVCVIPYIGMRYPAYRYADVTFLYFGVGEIQTNVL